MKVLGCLPASGQFPVGRLSAPWEHWLVGSSSSTVAGEVLPSLDSVRSPFHLWLLFEPLIFSPPHFGYKIRPIWGVPELSLDKSLYMGTDRGVQIFL